MKLNSHDLQIILPMLNSLSSLKDTSDKIHEFKGLAGILIQEFEKRILKQDSESQLHFNLPTMIP